MRAQSWRLAAGEDAAVIVGLSRKRRTWSFTLHAGDTEGILRGNRLDEVDKLTVKGVEFAPGTLSTSDGRDELATRCSRPHSRR